MSLYATNRMKPNELKTLGHYTGFICVALSLFMLIPIICGWIFHDSQKYLNSFYISFLATLIVGAILYFKLKPTRFTELSFKGSLIFVTAIWFVVAFFAALPFYLSGDLSFIDAIYESMSAITTTGFTMYSSTFTYSYSIAMWKCLTQWLGGLGIILLLLALVPSATSLKKLYIAEGRAEQITPSIKHTSRIYFKIYLILTSIGIILYLLAGLNLFNSICYTFAAIATGGFSISSVSVDFFNTPIIQLVTIIIMLAGGMNFLIHYQIIKGKWGKVYKDDELKTMFILIALSTIIIAINLYVNGYYNQSVPTIIEHSLFQVVSVITSTGFQSTSIDYWPPLSYVVLIILMLTGSSMCSTSGGIKLYNIVIALRSVVWELYEIILPKNTVMPHKLFHDKYKVIKNEEIKHVLLFIIAYLLVFIFSVLIVACYNGNFEYIIISVASALGNTGLGPTFMSTSSPFVVKLIFIFDFWIGRIAIWPVLLVILYFTSMVKYYCDKVIKN